MKKDKVVITATATATVINIALENDSKGAFSI